MDIEIEMSVEEVMDVSANEDEPKGMNGDTDEDNEPTPIEPADSEYDTITTIASALTPNLATAPADLRLHARVIDAAASDEDKEKARKMLKLLFESSSAVRQLCRSAGRRP